MDTYDWGDEGFPLTIDNGRVCVSTNSLNTMHIYKIGTTGKAIHVDDEGRLLVSLPGNHTQIDLSDLIDGSNRNFSLPHTPTIGTINLCWNSMKMRYGANHDYVVDNNIIRLNFLPYRGNALLVDYSY